MAAALQTALKTLTDADLFQIVLAIFLWFALVVVAVWPAFAPRRWPLAGPGWNIKRLHGVFLPLLLLALFVWRAPELLFNAPYNIDESHLLSVAQQFTTDGVAWRSGDGETAGPLDSYILTWPVVLGLPFSYLTARLTGLACVFVTLFFLLKSVTLVSGRRRALLIILSAATFYLFAWQADYVHFSTEHLPVALLAVSGWLILVLWRKPQWTTALALGVVLGAVPFGKLQATPIALYLFAVAAALLLFPRAQHSSAPRDRWRNLGALALGALLVPIVILTPVIATGTWPDFVRRYLLNNFRYERNLNYHDSESYLRLTINFLRDNVFVRGLLRFSFLLLFLKLVLRLGRFDRAWLIGLGIAGGYLLATVTVILKPRMPFDHYLLLLPCPLLLFAAWLMRGMRGGSRPSLLARYSPALPLLFILLCLLPQAVSYFRNIHDRPELSDLPAPDPITPVIKALSQPGDTLAIWGWAPQYFVQTGLHSATRDGAFVLMTGQDFDYYRESFLADVKKGRPRIFIDASGDGIAGMGWYPEGWPHPAERARYTMYPPLAAYVDSHYRLQSEIASSPGMPPILIFVRSN